jgi:competence protein ComEA
MSTLQNYLGSCAVFKLAHSSVRQRLHRSLWKALFSTLVTLMCCHSAIALDINQSNEAELDSVKGMGPALSAKVLAARTQGPFKDWADLMQRVSGIRQSKAQQFSEQGLTVNGQAFATKP